MKVLVLNHNEVAALLPMRECVSVMAEAFAELARGNFHQPLRTIIKPAEAKGVMALMPAFRSGAEPLFGLKAICVFPGNAAIGKDAHQGGVLLFHGHTGELLAVVNASAITAIRTAAVSGLPPDYWRILMPAISRSSAAECRPGRILKRWPVQDLFGGPGSPACILKRRSGLLTRFKTRTTSLSKLCRLRNRRCPALI